jgi:hypothetical protein
MGRGKGEERRCCGSRRKENGFPIYDLEK